MRSRIQQWGNSLALRIPKPFAEEAGLFRHTEIDLSQRCCAGRAIGVLSRPSHGGLASTARTRRDRTAHEVYPRAGAKAHAKRGR